MLVINLIPALAVLLTLSSSTALPQSHSGLYVRTPDFSADGTAGFANVLQRRQHDDFSERDDIAQELGDAGEMSLGDASEDWAQGMKGNLRREMGLKMYGRAPMPQAGGTSTASENASATANSLIDAQPSSTQPWKAAATTNFSISNDQGISEGTVGNPVEQNLSAGAMPSSDGMGDSGSSSSSGSGGSGNSGPSMDGSPASSGGAGRGVGISGALAVAGVVGGAVLGML